MSAASSHSFPCDDHQSSHLSIGLQVITSSCFRCVSEFEFVCELANEQLYELVDASLWHPMNVSQESFAM